MNIKTAFVLLAALTAASTAACGGSSSSKDPTGNTRASLHRAKNCGDLLGDLKADAKFKVNESIDRQIQSIQKCIQLYGDASCASYGYGGYGYATGGAEKGAPVPASDANAGASSSSGGTAAPTSPAPQASSYSETNVQVKGVDEADIVKTDGSSLFLVHGRSLKVIKAWPATALSETSSTDIEGDPSEMFVANGKAVVYSTVNGADIFAAAGVTPKDTYQEFYPMYGGAPVASDARGGGAYPSYPGYQSGPYYPLSKITVLDVSVSPPAVTREIYFEGNYLDSRRVNNSVRTVLQNPAHGPKLVLSVYDGSVVNGTAAAPPPTDPSTSSSSSGGSTSGSPTTPTYPQTGTASITALENLRATNTGIIDASQLSDWLPYTFIKEGGKVRAQTVACEDFYVPSVGSTEAGMTEIASIDLANPAALPRETAILGHAETVYGSADTLYLAANAWVETPLAWYDNGGPVAVSGSGGSSGGSATAGTATATPGQVGTANIRPLANGPTGIVTAWPTNKTHVHKFEFATDPQFPNYVASGTVAGSVKDQFSLDDKDGFLRIATTENRIYIDQDGKYVQPDFGDPTQTTVVRPNSVSRLFVLGAKGPWLDTVGDVGELAPNEQLYSVRFVGPRGYVTTFRRVDPLFVFDLSQPSKPSKLAELTIPGFSEYMHPLDDNHLLTIGRDASATGQTQGLQLRIFDVTNGAAPAVIQQFTYSSSEYGSSEAEYDHKAFTYFDDKQLLAFPYWSNGAYGATRSSLEVFKVDAAAGFTKLGSIDHTALISQNTSGYYCGYYSPQVRRGVFLENWVFSISYGGVIAKDSANMPGAGATLPLAAPVANTGYAPPCAAY